MDQNKNPPTHTHGPQTHIHHSASISKAFNNPKWKKTKLHLHYITQQKKQDIAYGVKKTNFERKTTKNCCESEQTETEIG